MDLYTLERQIRSTERELSEEVRLAEISPSSFTALRCERLHRVLKGLKLRRKAALRAVQHNEPHLVPTANPSFSHETTRKTKKKSSKKSRDRVEKREENKWRKWMKDNQRKWRNEADILEFLQENPPLPKNEFRRASAERWWDENEDDREWEWNGRAIRVVKHIVEDDSDMVELLRSRVEQLERALAAALQNKENVPTNNLSAGESLGESRIRAREAAKRELQDRAKALRKEMEHNSAVSVQSVFRGHLGRKRMRQARVKNLREIQHQGACIIQAHFRGHMIRKELRGRKLQAQRETQEAAALVIQSHTRGRIARRKFGNVKGSKERRRLASCIIQAWWRGCMGRKHVHQVRVKYIQEAEEMYALMLQCAWRAYKARKERSRLEREREAAYEEAAAIMVQAAWRGHQARKRMRAAKKELEQVQDRRRELDYAERVKTTFYAKKFLNAKQRAALLIQSFARGFIERKRFSKLQAKKRREEEEDARIEEMLRAERERALREQQLASAKNVFEDNIRVPVEKLGGRRSFARLHVIVYELKKPYRLKIDATEGSSGARFSRVIDTQALIELLEPLLVANHPSLQEPDSGPIVHLVRHGIPPARKHLISWILNRIWLDESVDHELELCLGSLVADESTMDRLDKSLTAALPPSSPQHGTAKFDDGLSTFASASSRMKDVVSVSKAPATSNRKSKPTRNSFVVRYANPSNS